MERFYVEESSDLRFNTSPGGPLINDSTCLRMRSEVRDFLVGIVADRSIDHIVSIPRKGTWMIDDAVSTFLKHKGLRHLSFGTDGDLPSGSRVMVFDDSINTGDGVSKALDWVIGRSPETITVVSLAITEDALDILRRKYDHQGIGFEPMRVFQSYKDFNAYSELRPGCQNYFFAVAILPYVNTLNSNRNPGFCCWVISMGRSHSAEDILDAIGGYLEGIGGVPNPEEKGVAFDNALHMTFDLDASDAGGVRDGHGGFSKVRLSMVGVGDSWELSVAPIICPDIRAADVDGSIEDHVMSLSESFVESHRSGILDALVGFEPMDLGMRNLDPVHRGDRIWMTPVRTTSPSWISRRSTTSPKQTR